MSFSERLSKGWELAQSSFKILKANKKLIFFPILSGTSLLLVIGSFSVIVFANANWDADNIRELGSGGYYALLFVFYLINYFIIVFFNMALIHCTRLYFKGEEVSVAAGLRFSASRIGPIVSWAFFAATVGLIIRSIQENFGLVGKIITSLLGIVWSVATFFVVPIIAYENIGPIGAFKRSSQMMKEKWGESLAAGFSFGLIQFLAVIVICGTLFFLGSLIHVVIGGILAVAGGFLIVTIFSAVQTIFVSAVYHNINGDVDQHFNQQLIDNLFVKK